MTKFLAPPSLNIPMVKRPYANLLLVLEEVLIEKTFF